MLCSMCGVAEINQSPRLGVTSGQCTGDCVSDEFEQLTANLGRILRRMHALRGNLPPQS